MFSGGEVITILVIVFIFAAFSLPGAYFLTLATASVRIPTERER